MQFVRNSGSWLAIYLMGTTFFLAAGVFALFSAFNADNVKSTLQQEGAYDKFIPSALSTIKTEAGAQGADLSQLPVQEQWVKDAAAKAFPAGDLEQKTGTLIDGTFNWLEGETDRPEFTLDFTENKQKFGDEVGSYAQTRASSLPRCSLNNIPQDINAYTIECLPFGVSPATVAATARQEVLSSENFLKDPVVSSDELKFDNSQQDPFQQLEGARSLYENRGLYMWGLLALTAILGAAGYFLATDRKQALRRLYRSFILSAILLVVIYFVFGFVFNNLIGNFAVDALSRDVVLPVFKTLANQARTIFLIFAGVAAVIAGALIFISKKFQ